jgi:AcrR family transcriptional regulator
MKDILEMSRRTIERQARQRFILDAAARLFAKKGVENTSMEDIAAAVDYTRRTLYSYFRSRDEICLRVFMEDMAVRWARQQKAVAAADNGLAKILAWAESFYVFAHENPHSMRLQFYWDFKGIDRNRISRETFSAFKTLNDELADGLREIFRLGVEDGSLRPDLKIDLCISQYLYTVRTILNRAISPAYSFARFDPDEYVRHYLDLFSRGIRNVEGKPL